MKEFNIKDLRTPLPFQWRVQSCSQYGAILIPYIDARDQMDLLDEIVGPENWKDDYHLVGDRLICSLSIRVNGEWVTKMDVGSDTKIEKEKGGVSDAFKRAGVKWGINRQAYETDPIKTKTKEYKGKFYPIDDKGNFIKNPTKYCNELLKAKK